MDDYDNGPHEDPFWKIVLYGFLGFVVILAVVRHVADSKSCEQRGLTPIKNAWGRISCIEAKKP